MAGGARAQDGPVPRNDRYLGTDRYTRTGRYLGTDRYTGGEVRGPPPRAAPPLPRTSRACTPGCTAVLPRRAPVTPHEVGVPYGHAGRPARRPPEPPRYGHLRSPSPGGRTPPAGVRRRWGQPPRTSLSLGRQSPRPGRSMAPCRCRTSPRRSRVADPDRGPGGLEWAFLVYFIVQRLFRGFDPLPGPFAGFWRAPSGPPERRREGRPPGRPRGARAAGSTPSRPDSRRTPTGPRHRCWPPWPGAPGSTYGAPAGVGEKGFMTITAPAGSDVGPAVRRAAPSPTGIRHPAEYRMAFVFPPRGAAPHRTPRTTPTSAPELVRRPVRVEDLARVRPPRTERATRGDGSSPPGTHVPDPGTGYGAPPGGGTLSGLALLPPSTAPSSRGVPRGELPPYSRDMPGHPSTAGEHPVLGLPVPVHRAAGRPGAVGERSRRAPYVPSTYAYAVGTGLPMAAPVPASPVRDRRCSSRRPPAYSRRRHGARPGRQLGEPGARTPTAAAAGRGDRHDVHLPTRT